MPGAVVAATCAFGVADTATGADDVPPATAWYSAARLRVDVGSETHAPDSWGRLREALGEVGYAGDGPVLARLQFDFADRSRGWRNAWLDVRPAAGRVLRIGNQPSGIGIDESSGGATSPFLERPLTGALAPGRRLGAGVQVVAPEWTFRLGMFDRGDVNADTDRRGARAPESVLRVVRRFGESADGRLAVGVTHAATHGRAGRFAGDGSTESRYARLRGATTGWIEDVDAVRTLGVEAAWFHGPLLLVTERLRVDVRRDGDPTRRQTAWYAGAAWLVTGEQRRYRRGTASLGGVHPSRAAGALELTARFGALELERADGGRPAQRNLLVGLTWHAGPRVKVALEASRTRVRDPGTPGRAGDVVQLRFHANPGAADAD